MSIMKANGMIFALLLAGNVQAADRQSAAVQITLELGATCRLEADAVHGFGSWPAGGGAQPAGVALGSISVSCGADMPYAVGIDAGQNYDGTRRRMSSGAAYVPYVLRVSSGGAEWGDAGLTAIVSSYVETNTASAVRGTGTGSAQTFSVWGDADVSGAPAGTYTDSVNITVAW